MLLLRESIAAVVDRFDLSPGRCPSATINVVRWTAHDVDVLVLCDSPVIVRTTAGELHEVRDERLSEVDGRQPYLSAVLTKGFAGADDAWQALVAIERAARNRPGGYWIAEATPEAADHAVRATWPRTDICVVLAATDGVADGVDYYALHPNWAAAVPAAAEDPQGFIDAIHAAEESDSDRTRWPRSKAHDDKALAVIVFGD